MIRRQDGKRKLVTADGIDPFDGTGGMVGLGFHITPHHGVFDVDKSLTVGIGEYKAADFGWHKPDMADTITDPETIARIYGDND